jgi:hypothetical protein
VRIVGHGNTQNSWNAITEVEFIKDSADAKNQPEVVVKTESQRNNAELNIEVDSYNDDVRIWPNPNAGILNIQTSPFWSNAELLIYDTGARLIIKRKIDVALVQLNISNQPKGTYLVKLIKSNQVVVRKISY